MVRDTHTGILFEEKLPFECTGFMGKCRSSGCKMLHGSDRGTLEFSFRGFAEDIKGPFGLGLDSGLLTRRQSHSMFK